jgi:hypothetical protein
MRDTKILLILLWLIEFRAHPFSVPHAMIVSQRLCDSIFLIQPVSEVNHLTPTGTERSDGIGEKLCLPTAGRAFDDGGFSHEPDKTRDAPSRN